MKTLQVVQPDDPPQLLLRLAEHPDAPEIVLQIISEWPRRLMRSGRPRDLQRFARPGVRAGGPRIWTILVVPEAYDSIKEPTLIFVPARGMYAHNTPVEMKDWYAERAQLGHEARGRDDIATLSLAEAVDRVLA